MRQFIFFLLLLCYYNVLRTTSRSFGILSESLESYHEKYRNNELRSEILRTEFVIDAMEMKALAAIDNVTEQYADELETNSNIPVTTSSDIYEKLVPGSEINGELAFLRIFIFGQILDRYNPLNKIIEPINYQKTCEKAMNYKNYRMIFSLEDSYLVEPLYLIDYQNEIKFVILGVENIEEESKIILLSEKDLKMYTLSVYNIGNNHKLFDGDKEMVITDDGIIGNYYDNEEENHPEANPNTNHLEKRSAYNEIFNSEIPHDDLHFENKQIYGIEDVAIKIYDELKCA